MSRVDTQLSRAAGCMQFERHGRMQPCMRCLWKKTDSIHRSTIPNSARLSPGSAATVRRMITSRTAYLRTVRARLARARQSGLRRGLAAARRAIEPNTDDRPRTLSETRRLFRAADRSPRAWREPRRTHHLRRARKHRSRSRAGVSPNGAFERPHRSRIQNSKQPRRALRYVTESLRGDRAWVK